MILSLRTPAFTLSVYITLFILLFVAQTGSIKAANAKEPRSIKLNQLGYSPASSKIAVVPASKVKKFQVIDVDSREVVLEKLLSSPKLWSYSGEHVQQADFSAVTKIGRYFLQVKGQAQSHVFNIDDAPLQDVHRAAIKGFYFNRSGMAIDSATGGAHARAGGHNDTSIKVHQSAASESRPTGSSLSLPKGWYDAGDYGKYVVNSGISTYTLLAAYQHHKDLYKKLDLNIAESDNNVPDIIDEIKWNLDWLETMQDDDGGVYHKLTALKFTAMNVAPENDSSQRYVIGKSVTASLDFAAVLAMASRVFTEFESEFPGVAQGYANKAIDAYEWAKANPDALYKQPTDVATGAYDDESASDEFSWAAAELFLLTQQDRYYDDFKRQRIDPASNLTWSSVGALAFISLAESGKKLLTKTQYADVKDKLIKAADNHYQIYKNSAYGVSISEPDFVWGSNGDVLNNGLVLVQAYRLTKDEKYKRAAMSTVDYVLGKNATGYSFVTGYGDKTPMNIHHRISVSDNTELPVPGFLAGGPHSGRQDDCEYDGKYPATTYADTVCSYSTNEIAINWNAPLVYMLAAAQNISIDAE